MSRHRVHYRAVFTSDWHLGFSGSKAKQLLSFLKSIECDYLFLPGDIFGFMEMLKHVTWTKHCNGVLRRILKMVTNGTAVVYLPGNHDEGVRNFLPLTLGQGISVLDETIHTTSSGKRYLVIHGDKFDFVVGHMRWLTMLGSQFYDSLLHMNGVVHKIRETLGFKRYWSLSGYLKAKTKKAISFGNDFEAAALKYARSKGCDGVICGHIHTAKLEQNKELGLIYANCGDWVESLTALVENDKGDLELIRWHDLDSEGIEDAATQAVGAAVSIP